VNYGFFQKKTVPKTSLKNAFESILPPSEKEVKKVEGGLRTQGIYKKSSKSRPLVSIVTVVYNGEKYLEQTIRSVINQRYDNIEYIIIDGGSTDGTLDIVEKHEKMIDYWISEPDEGIFDAMNKGIKICRGELIGLINADDYYAPNAIERVVSCYLKEKPDLMGVA